MLRMMVQLLIAYVMIMPMCRRVQAQGIAPYYAGSYSFNDLGAPPGVPISATAMTFKLGDPDTLLIAGNANRSNAAIYSLSVIRDAQNHITSFSGSATFFANAYGSDGPNGELFNNGIDAGLAYGPNGVLFYTSYNDHSIAQIKPGSINPDKFILLQPLGYSAGSTGGLSFVPAGMPGAGKLKITSYTNSRWYEAPFVEDGNGTYDLLSPPLSIGFPSAGSFPLGLDYVQAGNPLFPNASVMISSRDGSGVPDNRTFSTYEVDSNGDPILSTRRDFLSGLYGPYSMTTDPLTGDRLITYDEQSKIGIIRGFHAAVPEPGTIFLTSATALGFGVYYWQRKRRQQARLAGE